MVACVQPLAGAVALQVLQQGGNAVDAALAANAMLAVVEPSGCGVGGDLFAIVRTADGRFVGYNGSGRSPAAPVHHQGSQVPKLGAGSVTVPGCVDAWECLSRTHGTMPLARLLQPAIDAARAGTPVSEVIAACWTTDNFTASREIIGEPYYSAAMALFQRAPKAGQLWRNPDLARTLERVAQGGASAFYNEVLQPFGAFTRADFAAHVGTTQVVPVLSAKFRGATAHELPPNCSGLAVLIMVRVLDGFDLHAMNAADALHVQIEAKKLAYADASTFFGDGNDCAHLLDEEHIAALRARIRMDTVLPSVPEPPAARQKDTTCLSVADARSGVMISLIQVLLVCARSSFDHLTGEGGFHSPTLLALGRALCSRERDSCCKTAARALCYRRVTPTRTRHPSARTTPSFRRLLSGTTARVLLSWPMVSWVATCKRRATRRCCRRSWTAA